MFGECYDHQMNPNPKFHGLLICKICIIFLEVFFLTKFIVVAYKVIYFFLFYFANILIEMHRERGASSPGHTFVLSILFPTLNP